MKKKIFRGIVKSFNEAAHTATIFISTGDIDRDMEVIEPKAFQKNIGNYLAHPVLLSSHRTETLTRQIVEAKAIRITDQGVEGDYEWYVGKGNPEADWGWFLVTRGIAAFSVGFMAKAWLDKWTNPMISAEDSAKGIVRRYTEIELFENSQVLIPANPNAMQRRLGEAQGEEKELLELATKELKEDEVKPFSEAEEAQEKARYEESRKVFLAWFKDPEVKSEIEKIFKEIKEEKKHYSELLLGTGANALKQLPTEGKKEESVKQPKPKNTDAILGAIREGIKEGVKCTSVNIAGPNLPKG
jgi:hypothetical protein